MIFSSAAVKIIDLFTVKDEPSLFKRSMKIDCRRRGFKNDSVAFPGEVTFSPSGARIRFFRKIDSLVYKNINRLFFKITVFFLQMALFFF